MLGALNTIVGVGGAGKGTFVGWLIARWSKGELPGQYEGTPTRTLVVGDEDDVDESWGPRIDACQGDVDQVRALNYDAGVPLDLVADIGALEEIVRTEEIRVIYFDQILDHIHRDSSSHSQKDVRTALAPVRSLARRLGIAVLFSMHPNKLGSARAIRDRAGGSGQLTDLPRSALMLGYHPDHQGRRAVARGKGNHQKVPLALSFDIESGFVTNPRTREVIEVAVLSDLDREEGLTAEEVELHPPRSREEAKTTSAEQIVVELGDDGAWRPRRAAERACEEAEISSATFRRVWRELAERQLVETRRAGREIEWRLQRGTDR